ncbi:MAG: PRC-barrel domain-containing protein [Armatimonadota bacterium]
MQGENKTSGQLVRLRQIDYETEPGQPDLLGWEVADSDNNLIGKLDDMLVDTDTGEILFGSVCYNDRCIVVPLELMFMDEANKQLVLPVSVDELVDAPEFTEETEDMQPHIRFWTQLVSDWEEEPVEDEES